MTLKFSSGNFEELKVKLKNIIEPSLWKEVNINTHQARLANGAVVNYYSSTGSIFVQGKQQVANQTLQLIEDFLNNKPNKSRTASFKKDKKSNDDEEHQEFENTFLASAFPDTEIVIGLVGAVGVEYKLVIDALRDRLKRYFNYEAHEIKVSDSIITKLPFHKNKSISSEYDRIVHLMEEGNKARELTNNNAFLALGIANEIKKQRKANTRNAYIVNTLKHPEEVKYLREIYGRGFYLIGVFSDQKDRHNHLTKELMIPEHLASELIERDKDEKVGHGQHTSDTFDLSDFFVYIDANHKKLKSGIHRFLDIIFGATTVTPTFDEYAMFMAFANSLRSADLSRQVGAVLANDGDIIATGANDCPKYGGGLYWPYYDEAENEIVDTEGGRDYTRGIDSNAQEKQLIINDIIKSLPEGVNKAEIETILRKSRIKDLTEYGRVVHAEMETLMVCARNNISARNATLFCTTFPCHNCAKHLIAAGVKRVVYIEPYPKSKALEFHSDSIVLGFAQEDGNTDYVYFEPFTGLGPRKFFDLFSMSLGSGRSTKRKDESGKVTGETPQQSRVKLPLIPLSYLDREDRASKEFEKIKAEKKQ